MIKVGKKDREDRKQSQGCCGMGVPEFVGSWGALSVHSARPECTDWCLLVTLGVFALVYWKT